MLALILIQRYRTTKQHAIVNIQLNTTKYSRTSYVCKWIHIRDNAIASRYHFLLSLWESLFTTYGGKLIKIVIEQKKQWKIQWKCNINTNKRTCIVRPDHVKKSTQQSLCINFVRRRSSATLGNVKLNCSWHCFTRATSDVLTSLINSRLTTKSNDWAWVLFRGHASSRTTRLGCICFLWAVISVM